MKVLKTLLWMALGVATLSSIGCVRGYYERERVVERRPVVVEQRPVYVEPPRREVIIERAPPPPMLEVRVR